MSANFPTLRLHYRDGAVAARDGVVVAFFIPHDHRIVTQACWRALQAYVRAIPPQSLNWYGADDGDVLELDADGWEVIRKRMVERPSRLAWHVDLSDLPGGTGGYQFEYHSWRIEPPIRDASATAMSFTFPTEFLLEQGPQRMRALVVELARELPFHFGYASFALASRSGSWTAGDWKVLEEYSARYLGVDLPAVASLGYVIGTHALGAHWLTFLGPPLLDRLGGIEALRQALPFPEVSFLPMDHERLLLTLSEWPEAIDIETSAVPPQYRALACLLKPFMYEPGENDTGIGSYLDRWRRRLCP
ncbi:type VI immunity family protein [Corallococcus sp. EGB]|uniref:type VI immunity family protein n=1 Tax=Corallococcus sp. EGB TaxID=1521117 RepID=UPI001CBC3092|nr:type VI immunity family protein [Corallococcus sp. EGB]